MQIKGYNLLMHQDDYIAAGTYLNSLSTTSSDQQAYIYAQNIYLDHLIDRNISPSDHQLSTLYQYGVEDNVLSGSIRAIDEYFTDELIELDITIDGVDPPSPRNARGNSDTNNISIYPNPVPDNSTLRVELSTPLVNSEYIKVNIIDFNGKQIIDTKTNQVITSIDLSSLNSGVYIVIISDRDGMKLLIEKLIVI